MKPESLHPPTLTKKTASPAQDTHSPLQDLCCGLDNDEVGAADLESVIAYLRGEALCRSLMNGEGLCLLSCDV